MARLDTYRRKRDFAATKEPRGRAARKPGRSFVVQKHDARRLHYDFRLEMDGVLRSWAVTRGPSLVPGEKRLAVHVEDHPLAYGDFEGTIPKGEYGGGTVIVWDRGTWTPVEDADRGYAKGHLEFELHGEKLAGRWHLVRMRGKPNDVRMRGKPREKHENWLLIKGEDDAARAPDAPDILEEQPQSAKTGRRVEDVAGEAPGWSSKTGRINKKAKPVAAAPLPDFVAPALATLVAKPPAGDAWLHEIKFDGYRLQARLDDGRLTLLTRSGLDWTQRFGRAIPEAFRALPAKAALIDGEVVVEGNAGASDFSALQADLSEARSDRFLFYVFDLLHLDGVDWRAAPLIERKQRLAALVEGSALRLSADFAESGEMVLRHACRLSLEGIVSKRKDAPYRSGRGKDWVKSKCANRQEFVVAGYVPSSTSRRAVGSLVLGLQEDGKLRHVGRVGTGFTDRVAQQLFTRLETLHTPKSPFATRLAAAEARDVRYVRPELVAEVEFRAWTADRHLRHASFRGLREDKTAAEVVPETPPPRRGTAAAAPRPRVHLTHPDRIYWPDAGVTKEGLADHYAGLWPEIAPFIVGRPLALLRCPSGIGGQHFFQKHAWKGMNGAIAQMRDPKAPGEEPLVAVNDLDGLIGLVQAASLEIHPWGSTLQDWERPDILILDLDPGEGVTWAAVIAAAEEAAQRLRDAGLEPYVKTSGGKGLHVVAPLKPKADWPAVKAFTKGVAEAMAADDPNRFVATIAKAKRRGKILVDYLRNQRGATAVAPFSTRARPGAPVSMPLAWEELGPAIGPAHFTVANTPARLAGWPASPWADFRRAAAPLATKPVRRAS